MRTISFVSGLLFLLTTSAIGQNSFIPSTCDTSKIKFRAVAEIGFIAVLAHHIQLGENGTYFNYVKNGGQDVLFPATRFSIEMNVNKRKERVSPK